MASGSGGGQLLLEERESGAVSSLTYRSYVAAMGGCGSVCLLAALLAGAQACAIGVSVWVAEWAESEDQGAAHWLPVFAALALCALLFGALRADASMRVFSSASARLHAGAVARVLRAPMAFFDGTPLGRVLNRLTKDVGFCDDLLPLTLFDFLQCALMVLGTVLLTCIANPLVVVAVLPLGAYFYALRGYFLGSSRSIKRVEATSRSPLYAFLAEALGGLPVLRASLSEGAFLEEFSRRLDDNTRLYFLFVATARWFGYKLDVIVTALFVATTFSSLAVRHYASAALTIEPAVLGASLVYILQLAGLFQWCVRQSAEVENQMISVERLVRYAQLPQEAPARTASDPPRGAWPSEGRVDFVELTARYRPDLSPVLRGVSFSLLPGERMAVVGRTGAGKSSLFEAFFRLMEPEDPRSGAPLHAAAGSGAGVRVDGVATSAVGLFRLREAAGVIPQTPFLFSGSVRENMDPFGEKSDAEIWDALRRVQMEAPLRQLGEGLDAQVGENGGRLSVGERQLLCLARSILRRCKLLFMDEATANIDNATDALIQTSIRTSFRDCTVVVIAHRLGTIIDSDKVLVLDAGRVVECAHPHELLDRFSPAHAPDGRRPPPDAVSFAAMVAETGPDMERDLRRQAKAAFDGRGA